MNDNDQALKRDNVAMFLQELGALGRRYKFGLSGPVTLFEMEPEDFAIEYVSDADSVVTFGQCRPEEEKRWVPAMDAMQSDADKLRELEFWAGYHDKNNCGPALWFIAARFRELLERDRARPEEAIRDAALEDVTEHADFAKVVLDWWEECYRNGHASSWDAGELKKRLRALTSAHSSAPRVDEKESGC